MSSPALLRTSTLALGLLLATSCGGESNSADAVPVTVLTYNIGNPNADGSAYQLRLKEQAYEDFVSGAVRALSPDVVLFQEVLAPTHCDTFTETDPSLTCFDNANRPSPVRRILGDDYSIVCDSRRHVECIGVHTDFGEIDGVTFGTLELSGALTPPLPMATCDWASGDCTNDLCDGEATVSAATVHTELGDVRIVHAHPNAPGTTTAGAYTGAPCRHLQLQQIFEGVTGAGDAPLVTGDTTIVAGDFNMDPVRFASDDEMSLWARNVGSSQRFTDMTPVDENGAQHATRRAGLGLAIDHVLADRASGSCIVHGDDFLGTDPGTLPLDEGFDWALVPDGEFYAGRIDHFAVSCELSLDLTAP